MDEDIKYVREQAITRARGRCEWPTCGERGAELAHIKPRSVGGPDTMQNVAWLCKWHHDLFDGRTHHGLRREMQALLRAALHRR